MRQIELLPQAERELHRAASYQSRHMTVNRRPPKACSSAQRRRRRHVVCLFNDGYAASLECRKIYVALPDRQAHQLGLARVVDESGEDYLFPKTFFADIKLSPHLAKALADATQ